MFKIRFRIPERGIFALSVFPVFCLTGSNVTLKTAFKQIEQQTKLFVDYNTQEVNDSRVLTKLPKNSNVKEVMEQLLEGSGCSITFSNGHIIINKQARTVSSTNNILPSSRSSLPYHNR